jgi:prophage maintenance system killer protein
MSDPLFLTVEQIETLHKLALEQHGGQDGVRDRAALESAAAQPRNVFYYSGGIASHQMSRSDLALLFRELVLHASFL